MSEIGVPYLERVPDYEIRNEMVHVMVDGKCLGCFPIIVFEMGIVRSQRAIAEYRAKQAEIIDFRQVYPANKMRRLPD